MTAPRRRGPLRRIEAAIGAAGKFVGLVGTALKLAQLVPAAVALAVLFVSPSAWLSDTLRRWALAGVAAGTAAGMLAWALLRRRVADRGRLGAGLLLLALAAVAALRLHLALVDLGFVARWPVLAPLQDAILGSDVGERLYNLGAAAWFGLALFLATLGLPLHLRGRADRRAAAVATGAAPDPRQLAASLTALTEGIAAFERAHAALLEENRRLRARVAVLEARAAGGAGPGAAERTPLGAPEP